MYKSIKFTLTLNAILFPAFALACNGVFDPQTGICHQSNGYEIPGQIKSQPQPRDYWGAIAIDTSQGRLSGSSWGELNKNVATKKALNTCDDSRVCKVVLAFKNSCGAVAVDGISVNTASAASDVNPRTAESKAIALCNKKSTNPCHIWVKAKCSGAGY